MLSAYNTKRDRGIVLCGEREDLQRVIATVDRMVGDRTTAAASYAHRLATGLRVLLAESTKKADGVELGMRVAWPVFLFQLGVMASHVTRQTARGDLLVLVTLRHLAYESLAKADLGVARLVLAWLQKFPRLPENYLVQWVVGCAEEYLFHTDASLPALPPILDIMLPTSREYRHFANSAVKMADEHGMAIEQLSYEPKWPAIAW